MPTSKDNKTKKRLSKRGLWLIITGVTLVCLLAFDLSPFGGNIRFYSKWAECGHKPLVTGGKLVNTAARVSYFYAPDDVAVLRPYSNLFCTQLEAEQKGYSANRNWFSYPKLEEKNGRWCRYPTDPVPEAGPGFSDC